MGKSYGSPAPYIYFVVASAGHSESKVGVTITASQKPFKFSSADFYSSVSRIPSVLTGKLKGDTVLLQSGIVPNTYGNFATIKVEGQFKNVVMDMLEVQLKSYVEMPGGNPVGIDNIVVIPVAGPGAFAPEPILEFRKSWATAMFLRKPARLSVHPKRIFPS